LTELKLQNIYPSDEGIFLKYNQWLEKNRAANELYVTYVIIL